MSTAHFHLIFVHFPIVGLIFAMALNIYSLIRKNPELYKAVLWTYVAAGLSSLLAYLTGEGAEELILTLPGYTEEMIELHEELALAFFIGLLLVAVVSAYSIYISRTRENMVRIMNVYLLIAAILLSVLAFEVGLTGGKIRHTELEQVK